MKKELQEAKALLEKGMIKEALDLLKSMSVQFKGSFGKCPGCGVSVLMLQKEDSLHGECKKCGAVWGGKTIEDLVKLGDNMKDETKKLTKKQVIEQLWELYRVGDPDADAFSINSFEATGWLKKSLAVKLGLPLPEEKLEKSVSEEVVKEPVASVGETLRGKRFPKYFAKSESKKELITEHKRLVDVLRSPSHKDDAKEAAIQSKELKELKDSVKKNDMSRDDVLETMLGMFKAGEEAPLVNRHSIAKYETTGEITEEVLKVVFRKAKRDYNELCKGIDAEEIKKFDDEDEEKHHKHMQRMIDDGSVWHFEGAMGRHAVDLMRAGKVTLGPKSHKDFYGNHVPAHHEVKPGTLGSKEYQKRMQDSDMDKTLKVPPKKEAAPAKEHQSPVNPQVGQTPPSNVPPKKGAAPMNNHQSQVSPQVGKTPPSMVSSAPQTDSKGGVSVHVHVDRGGPGATSQPPKPPAPPVHNPAPQAAAKPEHKPADKKSPPPPAQIKKAIALKKECGPKVAVKKTDKNSPRGRSVLPEGELKEGMKDAGEYTGPAKPIVKKK